MEHALKYTKDVLRKYCQKVDALVAGSDLSPYCYQEKHTEEYGTSDAHYNARLQLVYGLHFYKDVTGRPLPASCESLIRKLFCEELQDRKTDSFQGIGVSLELLTKLLSVYDDEEDQALFSAAKNANFDCACGYDPGLYDDSYFPLLPEMDLMDLTDLMSQLQEEDAAKDLLSMWVKEQDTWTRASLSWLSYRQKKLRLDEDELATLAKMADISRDEDTAAKETADLRRRANSKRFQLLSDLKSYAWKLKELGHSTQSLETVKELLALMDEGWYSAGLGRDLLELSMELILTEKAPLSRADCSWLWQQARPWLLQKKDNMHWNLYRKVICAADKMEEPELAAMFKSLLAAAQEKSRALFAE